jgi:predicted Rdx family selenoprotein
VLKAEGYEAIDTPGAKSQFDVLADGRLVFSKQREGRFPETDEILGALRT